MNAAEQAERTLNDLLANMTRLDALAAVIDDLPDESEPLEALVHSMRTLLKITDEQISSLFPLLKQIGDRKAGASPGKTAHRSRKAVAK